MSISPEVCILGSVAHFSWWSLVPSLSILQGAAREQQVSLVGRSRDREGAQPHPCGVPHAELQNSHAPCGSGIVRLLGLRKPLLVSCFFVAFMFFIRALEFRRFNVAVEMHATYFGGRPVK